MIQWQHSLDQITTTTTEVTKEATRLNKNIKKRQLSREIYHNQGNLDFIKKLLEAKPLDLNQLQFAFKIFQYTTHSKKVLDQSSQFLPHLKFLLVV